MQKKKSLKIKEERNEKMEERREDRGRNQDR